MAENRGVTFETILEGLTPEIQEVAREVRTLLYQVMPQVIEVVWTQQRTAGYGTGPKKMSEHFCWIAPYKKHVLLGFNYGSELPDPEHRLKGTGKSFRHITFTSKDEVRNPAVRTLVEVASTHRVPPPLES